MIIENVLLNYRIEYSIIDYILIDYIIDYILGQFPIYKNNFFFWQIKIFEIATGVIYRVTV